MSLDNIQVPDYRVTQELYKDRSRVFFRRCVKARAKKSF